jgi:hypothetical protein
MGGGETVSEWTQLLQAAEQALHLLETPGDFNDGELACVITDLDEAIREVKGGEDA